MKKILLSLLIALVSVCFLYAGGSSENADGDSPITLTVMNWQFNEAGKGDMLRAMLAEYGEIHNIQFEEISIPWGSYPDTLFTRWASGDAPDIVFIPDASLANAVDMGYVLPLSDYIDFSQYEDEFSPLINELMFDGKYYGFLSEAVIQELIYLPDLLEEAGLDPNSPPTTVDEFIEYASKIAATNPDYIGYGTRNSMDQSIGWYSDYSSWAYGFGARWAENGVPTINSKENVDALTAYKRMYDSGAMTKGVTSTNYRKAMSIGQCGFITDNSSNIFTFLSDNPELNVASAPLPFPCEDSVTELVVLGVSNDAPHKEEAVAFVEWFMAPENYIPWMESISCPTGAYKQSVSDEWIEANPTSKAFIEGANHATTVVPDGLGVYMGEFRDIVLRHMETVLLNNVDPQTALDAAQNEVLKMLE